MSLHGKSTGKNIHTPFRFVVADATERLAVSTNPDGSALDNTALNTKLIQVNDNSEWRLSSISPVTFMAIAPVAHSASHTDSTDDIQSATNAQKGLATAAHIAAIEANTAKVSNVEHPSDTLVPQNITDIGNLSGTNTGDQDLSGKADKATTYTETEVDNLLNAVWTEITQAAYDALSPPDASTLYVIVG